GMDAQFERLRCAISCGILSRFGTPEDLGKVLVFLASDAAGYMNGCHVEISGGKRCVQNPQFSYQ
uniref:SDR family oxidoreductase n=1 Tax=Dysosmobacter sp. TaxID=2591382 RepID=UPI003FD8246B